MGESGPRAKVQVGREVDCWFVEIGHYQRGGHRSLTGVSQAMDLRISKREPLGLDTTYFTKTAEIRVSAYEEMEGKLTYVAQSVSNSCS